MMADLSDDPEDFSQVLHRWLQAIMIVYLAAGLVSSKTAMTIQSQKKPTTTDRQLQRVHRE